MFWAARPRSHVTDTDAAAARGSGVTSAMAIVAPARWPHHRPTFASASSVARSRDGDERPALEVPGGTGPSAGIQDGRHDLGWQWPVIEGADDSLVADGVEGLHDRHGDTHTESRPGRYRGRVTSPATPPGPYPGIIEVVVEYPRGSRNKYEYDPEGAGSSVSTACCRPRCSTTSTTASFEHPRRGRRPDRHDAAHRRADVPGLSRVGAPGRGVRCATTRASTSRCCV